MTRGLSCAGSRVAERLGPAPWSRRDGEAIGIARPEKLVGPLALLGAARASYLAGRSFLPRLIACSFQDGLRLAFDFGAGSAVMSTIASWVRGGKCVRAEEPLREEVEIGLLEVGEVAAAAV